MYATATVSTASVLFTDLSTFCVANGWTINTDQVEGSGRRITLSKQANHFVHLRLCVNETPVPNNSYPYGIGMMCSRTNTATSFNSGTNNEFSYSAVVLPINPSIPVTYHFFSTADGNSIAIAVTSMMVTDPSKEYNCYLGFGTSIIKTTTVNETWYQYGVNTTGNALDYSNSGAILTSTQYKNNSFLTSNGGPGSTCYGQLGIFSTTAFYNNSATPNFYNSTDSGGNGGICGNYGSSNNGVGNYNYLFENTASSVYANTVLIPSFIFMKHPTVGINLIGTIPLVWAHRSVPLLYKSGTHITINGKEYVVFRNNAYEVIP